MNQEIQKYIATNDTHMFDTYVTIASTRALLVAREQSATLAKFRANNNQLPLPSTMDAHT